MLSDQNLAGENDDNCSDASSEFNISMISESDDGKLSGDLSPTDQISSSVMLTFTREHSCEPEYPNAEQLLFRPVNNFGTFKSILFQKP